MANLASLDLPSINPGNIQEDDAKQIKGYLYQLNEQLRYVLGNLDEDNLSAGLTKKIEQGGQSSEIKQELAVITLQVAGLDDATSTLKVGLTGIIAEVQAQGGQISTLTQTAQSLTSRIENAENNYSTLSQTVDGIETEVGNAEGNISTLSQTVSGLTTRVGNAEGNVSSLQQMANSLKLSVTNGTNSSTLTLTGDGITASSAKVQFTGDVVFKSDLVDGRTTISGSNITTGTINCSLLDAGTISHEYSYWNMTTGEIRCGLTAGTRTDITAGEIKVYKDNNLTGVVRSVIGNTYYTANSTYCYMGWCDNDVGTNTGTPYGYGGHGLHTLAASNLWTDGTLDISCVVERGLAVEGVLRATGNAEVGEYLKVAGKRLYFNDGGSVTWAWG